MSKVAIRKTLITLGNEVLSAFRRASRAFARHSSDYQTASPSEATCKAEFQRFQLWVINLGLFQSSHNSLDYRLRQNETVRSLVAALLNDLCLALEDLVDQLSRDRGNDKDEAEDFDPEIRQEKLEGGGGSTGADSKKRRGVRERHIKGDSTH
ncbi:MAG: hypothetical protein Q9221_004931 [Calogaya cf. arnoldii]